MNTGKTLFAEVMEFVPWTSFTRIVQRYNADSGVRRLNCAEQFRIMAFAQLTWRESLRDIQVTLGANSKKLYAMGFRNPVRKSTLADANEVRDWRVWSDLAVLLIKKAHKLYASEDLGLELDNTVYALDATTIDLCLSLFDWAAFRTAKAAVKLHTILDLRGSILVFIHISDGKMHEVNVLDMLTFEPGAFYVMGRGHIDFRRLYKLHQSGSFFVTRAKSNLDARRVYSQAVDKDSGLIYDQTIMLNGFYKAQEYSEHLRRIKLRDPKTEQILIFLTNNTSLPAQTIAALYKSRWQVELFFKWIKQHLRIKKFLGNSENAVKTQIWCAVSTYVLIAIIRKELKINTSLYTILQILSVSVFEKSEISWAFQPGRHIDDNEDDPKQMNLLGF